MLQQIKVKVILVKIVKVSAVWCPGCLVMRNVWKRLKEKYSLDITDYDYDMNEEDIKQYNVGDKLPVTIFFDDNNNEISRVIGEKTFEELDDIINNLIG